MKDFKNFLVKDKRYGKLWYGKILSDGTQLWAEIIDNMIRNCGINDIPRDVNLETGLTRQSPPEK